MFEEIFLNKKACKDKLIQFGFAAQKNHLKYSVFILDHQFRCDILADQQDKISTRLIDNETGDEYVLYLAESVSGAFVGKIRQEIQQILEQIADQCFKPNVFKNPCTHAVIAYIEKQYGHKVEFLWAKTPNNAIVRRPDNQKWYAAILTVAANKIGLVHNDTLEIIDLRIDPTEIEKIIDYKQYFPAYHMNKKHWVTMLLDGSVPLGEITRRIDQSYWLAQKK